MAISWSSGKTNGCASSRDFQIEREPQADTSNNAGAAGAAPAVEEVVDVDSDDEDGEEE